MPSRDDFSIGIAPLAFLLSPPAPSNSYYSRGCLLLPSDALFPPVILMPGSTRLK